MTKLHLRAALLAASSLLVLAVPAHAAEAAAAEAAADAGDQSSTANQAGQANDKQSLTSSDIIVTASRTAEVAPVTASLTTTQPQAAVSRAYIDNANAGADFNQLITITPGVSLSGSGNGQGFSETKAVIRGFQDGEYNVTYDSIPFADTNNPTHHSTAFFPSSTIETVVVDRGPGNASQLGQASFGGNVNMYSRAAADERGGQIQALSGLWNSFIGRFELQSGKVAGLGGAKFVLSGQYLQSDGALTWSPVKSKNLFFKAVVPLGETNTLTLVSTWNRNFYYQSDVLKGATCGTFTTANPAPAGFTLRADNCAPTSNIGQFGIDYGMSNDPTRADYYRYNRTDKTTDFSYIRLQSELGSGFSMDNRAYMYAYTNNTLSGNGAQSISTVGGVTKFTYTGGTVKGAPTGSGPYVLPSIAGHIAGYNKLNKYRVLGYIGQINYDFPLGKVRLGGWYEHAETDRHLFNFDWSNNGAFSYVETTGLNLASLASAQQAYIRYLQHSTWNQYQLFGELEFRPIEALAITPGVKYVHFTRGIDAVVTDKSARVPSNAKATWTKTLPFLTANYQPTDNWSIYGQYAQGMYVPDLSSFYSTNPNLGTALAQLQPMTTTNYQVGTVWHGSRVAVDVDGYIIDVNNKIAGCTSAACGNDSSILVNIGQVRYKGVEGQVSVEAVKGLSLFANASYNYAHSVTSGAQVAKAPYATAAAGFVYAHDGLRVSFTQKITGTQYATEYSGTGLRNYRIAPYGVGEFAASQDFGMLRLGVQVSNVFNSRAITSIASGKTYGVDDQFSFLPPRSFLVDARVKF
ncbi:MAG TPA: TonB-dependent receptor [Novosphingobium sp.]|nr:TonB-dependent receptor [Novosphingobium sp.]